MAGRQFSDADETVAAGGERELIVECQRDVVIVVGMVQWRTDKATLSPVSQHRDVSVKSLGHFPNQ